MRPDQMPRQPDGELAGLPAVQRWHATGDYAYPAEEREDGEFVAYDDHRAELLRRADENARLNKIESLATEQRLQTEDVELYLMEVSQPDDEDAPWCDRMKSAIELLVQDCNSAVGQKNKAEAELAALNTRVFQGVVLDVDDLARGHAGLPSEWRGKRVRLVVEE